MHGKLPPLNLALAGFAADSKAWPFEEARKLLVRRERAVKAKRVSALAPMLFETGYGPSGLPHIGTFGEVARTTMVRNAFRLLTEDKVPTRLICFSDDMDGMRKVPENVPNRDMLKAHMHKPLTRVPDPFGKFESFGHHNNAMLRRFLDAFDFDYEFMSSTECYANGLFNNALLTALKNYQPIMDIMLPSLREERAQTYSPFLPVHPETGQVMQVPIEEHKPDAGTIVWKDPETGKSYETGVTDGQCKLQWKPDWGMRWAALGIDYEMAGKDHIEGMKLSAAITKVLGGVPPDGFNYELFLDDKGQKISKSKGNGLTIDEWLRYASPESLALFMYNRPREAKKLHFDVIPRQVEDYATHLETFVTQDGKEALVNPVWHIHAGNPPPPPRLGDNNRQMSFGLMLTLASTGNSEDPAVLWGFMRRYAPGVSPETHPTLDKQVGYAIAYYQDFVKPSKQYRAPNAKERAALEELAQQLGKTAEDATAEDLQNLVFEVGKKYGFEQLRDWFKALYEVLFGQSQGPRFGSFIAVYGVAATKQMIEAALARPAA
jgi:lysyl-tRNA synthetase, class I